LPPAVADLAKPVACRRRKTAAVGKDVRRVPRTREGARVDRGDVQFDEPIRKAGRLPAALLRQFSAARAGEPLLLGGCSRAVPDEQKAGDRGDGEGTGRVSHRGYAFGLRNAVTSEPRGS